MDTFICANTKNGFYSLAGEILQSGYSYIIKGGPGTGKSSFLKRTAASLEKAGHSPELIHCSSDPGSLDGLFLKASGVCVFDGTAPHTADPNCPGADGEILNFGGFWDSEALYKSAEQIKALNVQKKKLNEKAYRLLSAGGKVYEDLNAAVRDCVNGQACCSYAANFAKRNFKPGSRGNETLRFMRAINGKGISTLTSPLKTAKKVYCLYDKYETVGACVVQKIREKALLNGQSITTFLNPLEPEQPDCVFIHGLDYAFTALPYPEAQNININRFASAAQIAACRVKLNFVKKLKDELVADACAAFAGAGKLHGEMEAVYLPAMNFDKLRAFERTFVKRIKAK